MKTRISFLIALAISVFAAVSCMMSDVCYEDGFLTGGPEMGQQNPQDGDKYEEFSDNPFVDASETPVSTFSVDADGASYANMSIVVDDCSDKHEFNELKQKSFSIFSRKYILLSTLIKNISNINILYVL